MVRELIRLMSIVLETRIVKFILCTISTIANIFIGRLNQIFWFTGIWGVKVIE